MSTATYTSETAPKISLRRSRRTLKHTALVLALLAGTATAAYYGHDYWTTGR